MHKHGHFCFWGQVEVETNKNLLWGEVLKSVISVFLKHIQWDDSIQVVKCYSIHFPLNTVRNYLNVLLATLNKFDNFSKNTPFTEPSGY